MVRKPPRSDGIRIDRRWVVFCPPLVSISRGAVMIDTGAARRALQGLAPTEAAALSATTKPSESEEQTLCSLWAVLQEGADAVVTTRAVSEAVKVMKDGLVVGDVDRDSLVTVTLPILIDLSTLRKLLTGPDVECWIDPIRAILGAGGAVRARFIPD